MTPRKKLTPAAQSSAPPPINWPPFVPFLPLSPLMLTTLRPSELVTIRRFWPPNLCRDYVTFLRTLPLVTTPGQPKRGEALRLNDRFGVDDGAFAKRLWDATGLRDVVLGMGGEGMWGGEVVGLNPNIRIYRYSKGQFFDQHYDDSNLLNIPTENSPTTHARTTWTLLLYLTSAATGCTGGQTVFYPKDSLDGGAAAKKGKNKKSTSRDNPGEIVVELETGMLLLHRHGEECMLHEGREVTDGEKWVIRTDLCVRR